MTATATKGSHTQAAGRAMRFALVGLLPGGAEVVIDSGREDEMERGRKLLENCPWYTGVRVKSLDVVNKREAVN